MYSRSVCTLCRDFHGSCRLPLARTVDVSAKRGLLSSHVSSSEYPLPWVHLPKPLPMREPLKHKLLGLFLLRRVANMHSCHFSRSDFLLGVKDAVYFLSEVIASRAKHDQLELLLQPELHREMADSLGALPENAHIHLDIESIRHLQLVSANAIIGAAEPQDEHVITWMGQKVIASRSKLGTLMEEDSKLTLNRARQIGAEATYTRLEFQLGVSFNTVEKFAVIDEAGKVVQGSNQFRECFHYWKFSSLVPWETDEYPFQWTIADMNDYLHNV